MQLDTPLPTKRLLLRSLTTAEATERYLGWMRDPLTTRYLEARLTQHSLGSLRNYIESCNAGDMELLLGIFLIDGGHIGNIKLGPVDWYHQNASVGLLIGEKRYWGNGYATEAITGVTAHAFRDVGLQKLYAGCYASNVGSARAFLKAGWSEEGRSRSQWRSDERRDDNIHLGITRSDWTARST